MKELLQTKMKMLRLRLRKLSASNNSRQKY
jgi:hypothetical protein